MKFLILVLAILALIVALGTVTFGILIAKVAYFQKQDDRL